MWHHFIAQIRYNFSVIACYWVWSGKKHDIRQMQNMEKILWFQREMLEMGMSRSTKRICAGELEELGKALFLWVKWQDLFFVKTLWNLAKWFTATTWDSLPVKAGGGCSVSGMEFLNLLNRMNSCLQIGLLQTALLSHSKNLLLMSMEHFPDDQTFNCD